MQRPAIQKLLPHLRSMPPLPEKHQRILTTLRDPFFSTEQVAYSISQDVCLTAHLLKVANSTLFAPPEPIHDLSAAIQLLGVRRLNALISSAWAFQLLDSVKAPSFNPHQEWDHALAVAMETQNMVIATNCDAEIAEAAFTAGLLHDLGKILIAVNLPADYERISADVQNSDRARWIVENELLGCNHAELGACLLHLWRLPEPVVLAVGWHHQPESDPSPALTPLTLLHLANCQVRRTAPDPAQAALIAGLRRKPSHEPR